MLINNSQYSNEDNNFKWNYKTECTVLFLKRTVSYTIKFCHIVPFPVSLKP